MDIVTVDFETYYDKTYNLKKKTTEAYIRDPKFEVIGVALKKNDGPSEWFDGDRIASALQNIDGSMAFLAHNCAFDGAIAAWHYGVKPRMWLDTLSMARPKHFYMSCSLESLAEYYELGVKGDEIINACGKHRADFSEQEIECYASYCINDVNLTHALYKKLQCGFPPLEGIIIDQIMRMYIEPVIELNITHLKNHLAKTKKEKDALLQDFISENVSLTQVKKLFRSNAKFAQLLKRVGVEPPTKTSPRTGKKSFAFAKSDKTFMDLQNHENEAVRKVMAARLGLKSSLEETRTKSMIAIGKRGKLPVMLNYYGAHTGRFSGGDGMNPQNFPRKGEIRSALCAPEGHSFIVCDASQIEARLLAWEAGQTDIVDAFRNNRDIYSEFATEIYGRLITKADKVERFVGKTCILGLGYQMGKDRFRDSLAMGNDGISLLIDENEAARIVRLYRQKNNKITDFWDLCKTALANMLAGVCGYIDPNNPDYLAYTGNSIALPNGLKLHYPALIQDGKNYIYLAKNGPTTLYGGKLAENITQALARIIITEQMAVIGRRYHIVLQVHDEIIIIVPDEEIEQARSYMERVMSTAPKWASDLPVSCESSVAKNYGEAK